MKYLLFLAFVMISCNEADTEKTNTSDRDTTTNSTKPVVSEPATEKPKDTTEVYSNTRFRNVTVQKVGDNSFRIKGQAQIFEANFSWVIEDGHNELAKGYQMTDAGAPEWGNFDFTVTASKQRENSTLHIILFEISAKDGSRRYELPIPLN